MKLIRRPRRLRYHPYLREMVKETHLRATDLIMPVFLESGTGIKTPIEAMPGQFRYSLDQFLPVLESWIVLKNGRPGIGAIILFGLPSKKDSTGSDALSSKGVIAQAIKKIKKEFPHLLVISDLCFCEYTDHGHCGVITDGDVDNDATLPLLANQAVIHAEAGVDVIAPSGMMDGMVASIRSGLDQHQFSHIPIMSYAVKYASSFYGPFREAVDSSPGFGDRRTYQMDPSNRQEAIREVELDIDEGADIIMVKPALPYLDILREIANRFSIPMAAYQVSGEYTMIKMAAQAGAIEEKASILESLTAIKRAGANLIISYFASTIVKDLN